LQGHCVSEHLECQQTNWLASCWLCGARFCFKNQ